MNQNDVVDENFSFGPVDLPADVDDVPEIQDDDAGGLQIEAVQADNGLVEQSEFECRKVIYFRC